MAGQDGSAQLLGFASGECFILQQALLGLFSGIVLILKRNKRRGPHESRCEGITKEPGFRMSKV